MAIHALIIEDEPIIALGIEDALRDNGFTSFCFALSEDNAISAAEAHRPDLITSDIKLSPGNGMDAVEAIIALVSDTGDIHHR